VSEGGHSPSPETGHRPQEQQEPVHAPYRGGRAPKRGPWTVVWVTVAVLALVGLGVALLVAAVRAA
jgi:hypothetical protein